MDVRRPIHPLHHRTLMARLPPLRRRYPRGLTLPPRLPHLRRQPLPPLRRRPPALTQLRRGALVPLPLILCPEVRSPAVLVL